METMQITMQVPKHLVKGLNNKSLIRYGSIIKDKQTGKIVGQLQDVGKLANTASNLFSGGLNPVSMVTQFANFDVAVATKVDVLNQKVDSLQILTQQGFQAIGQGLQQLSQLTIAFGIANLAVGVAGIGVSAVGFKKTFDKLNKIQDNMNQRFDMVDAKLDAMKNEIKQVHTSQIREIYCKSGTLNKKLRLGLKNIIEETYLEKGYSDLICETDELLMQQVHLWLKQEPDALDIATLLSLNSVYTEYLKTYSLQYYLLNGKYFDLEEQGFLEPSRMLYSKKALKLLSDEILSSKDGDLKVLNDVVSMYKYSIVAPYTELYNTQEVMALKSNEELLQLRETLSNIETSDGYALSIF